MNIFALFLPQFHTIKENDEWWGQGFTEWTNVRKAKALFPGHAQPIEPLDDNYYNLLDKSTVEWQTQLMKEYKIDGLVYYHYYFRGRKLLEKPAENLLRWKDIDQPFFFCWANHDWNRSWEGMKTVLIKQEYGSEEDWNEHFEYLLPFFKDERYYKIDNQPVFMLLNGGFDEKNAVFEFFDEKCKQNGFDGLYLIESFGSDKWWPNDYNLFKNALSPVTKRIFLREHLTSHSIYKTKKRYLLSSVIEISKKYIFRFIKKQYLFIENGNKLYDVMIKDEPQEEKIIHGAFFEWDNTSRHGLRGSIVTPPTRQKFIDFMDSQKNRDLLIFNAWNEWAEGMTLEPTKKNGYKYLEWIKSWRIENDR